MTPQYNRIKKISKNFHEDLLESFVESDLSKRGVASSRLASVRAIILLQKEMERLLDKDMQKKVLSKFKKDLACSKIYEALEWQFATEQEKQVFENIKPPDDEWLIDCLNEDVESSTITNLNLETRQFEFYFYEGAQSVECAAGAVLRQISSHELADDVSIMEFYRPDECYRCKFKNACMAEQENETISLIKTSDGFNLLNAQLVSAPEKYKWVKEEDAVDMAQTDDEADTASIWFMYYQSILSKIENGEDSDIGFLDFFEEIKKDANIFQDNNLEDSS